MPPNGTEQQIAVPDFAAKIRAKYPGSYDDMQDDVLANRILTKYPQYRDMVKMPPPEQQVPNAAIQSQQQLISRGKNLMNASGYPELANAQPSGAFLSKGGQPPQNADVQSTLGTLPALGGTMGAAFGGVPGATLGGGAGEALSQLIERAGNTGEQNQLGDLSRVARGPWQSPGADIAKQAAIMGTLEGAGKYVIGPTIKYGGKQIAKLFGAGPERIAATKLAGTTEEQIAKLANQAEPRSLAAAHGAYPKIDAAPVNVAATKNLARQASENIVSARVPAQINRVGAIPEPYQNVLTSDDPNVILKELAAFDNIPFRKAQLYRTAIEKYISQAAGKLPGDVYGQLKQISGSLGDALRVTANREGVLAEFNAAERIWKQHAADFWNKGAPLKPWTGTPPTIRPEMTGATANQFLNIAKQARALEALERRLGPQPELRALLGQGAKTVRATLRDYATLKNLGQPVLNRQVAKANRLSVLKATPYVIGGATGLGALEEYLRRQVFRKVAAK